MPFIILADTTLPGGSVVVAGSTGLATFTTMQFTSNADGSLSVTWTVPSVRISGSGSYLNQISPPGLVTNSDWPTSVVTDGYQIMAVLHLQFGSDPDNTIGDYYTKLAYSKDAEGNITTQAINQTQTIPLSVLANQLAGNGIYAIGFVGVGWNDGTTNGTLYLSYDYGTTAQNYRPTTPSAPGIPNAVVINGNQMQVSWSHATQGSAPIAGYRLRWGTSANGPYPNVVNCPIEVYPIGTTNSYVFNFQASAIPLDGTLYYFTVEAYDDGTATVANQPVDPQSISYFPGSIAASAVGSLTPITNYGTAKIWFGR